MKTRRVPSSVLDTRKLCLLLFSLPPVRARCAVSGPSSGEMSLTSCPILKSSWPGSPTRSKMPTRRRRRWRVPYRGSRTGHTCTQEILLPPTVACYSFISFFKCEKWDVKRKRGQEEGREWIGKEKMNKLHAAGESHEKNRD